MVNTTLQLLFCNASNLFVIQLVSIHQHGNRSQHNKKNDHLKKSRRRYLSSSNSNGDPIEFKQDGEEYPIARGLTTQRK